MIWVISLLTFPDCFKGMLKGVFKSMALQNNAVLITQPIYKKYQPVMIKNPHNFITLNQNIIELLRINKEFLPILDTQ